MPLDPPSPLIAESQTGAFTAKTNILMSPPHQQHHLLELFIDVYVDTWYNF